MNTIPPPIRTTRSRLAGSPAHANYRHPHYDCVENDEAIRLTVFVPGVEAAGVEITTQGTDLTVIARKSHFVRVNWQSLHLEGSQQDYRLRLRLGRGLAYESLQAELTEGRLTIRVPKRSALASSGRIEARRVA